MENLIKVFVGTMILILLAVTGITLLSSSVYSRQADRYLSTYERQLRNSNGSIDVFDKCKSDAEEQHYKLKGIKSKDYTDREYYSEISLTYRYAIPFAGNTEKTISSSID